MVRNYDIFEKVSDSGSIWRACVAGQFDAQRKIQELAEYSNAEFFAIDLTSHEYLPLRPRRSDERGCGNKRVA
jgi:hypothetical protein